MTPITYLRPIILAAAILLAAPGHVALAAEASGSGVARQGATPVVFQVELRTGQPATFSYFDYSTDPPRTIAFSEAPTIDCLGELFGGQAMRLSGRGIDSGAGGEAVSLQVFLVDGGDLGPDRLSVKATQPDGAVTYFAPLRDLESGSLVIAC